MKARIPGFIGNRKNYSCSKCQRMVKLKEAVEALGVVWHAKCVPAGIRGIRAVVDENCVKCQNEGEHDNEHIMEGQE